MDFLSNNFFLLALTFGLFFLSKLIQKRTGWVILNPILLTIALLIVFLKVTGISYETYNEGGHLIEFWLKPAVVALGVPLYLQLKDIKKQLLPILLSQLVGCLVGIVSVVITAKWLGASPAIITSLAAKSVTTPIAMEQGLSMGTASHAVGTSTAMERGRKYGAFASLGLTLNGLLTAMLTPTVLHLMGII